MAAAAGRLQGTLELTYQAFRPMWWGVIGQRRYIGREDRQDRYERPLKLGISVASVILVQTGKMRVLRKSARRLRRGASWADSCDSR